MNKRKLRRVAIVALVLVLLCNTLGVQAETGAPAVTVSSYEELVNAIDQASNLDTILIEAVIWIPEGASLGDSSKTVILKSSGGYMEIVENTQSEEITSFTGLIFDGAGKELLAPYLRITGAVSITGCTFKNCGVNGAINMSYASCTIKNSSFKDNKNDYGAHILIGYKSTADISNSSFTGGIATVRGGGIYLDDPTSTATLTECTITSNVGAYGGGIANWGSLTLENTLLYANTASVGGADLFSTGSYSMENSNNSSTVNNYYQQDKQEPATASTNASQPVNVTVPVTVSTPEAKGSNTATPEAPETTSIADKNINIEAKGVDVKLEITGDSYNISISAPEGQESQIQPVNEVSTVNASESTTEPQRSPNWIEYITVILLAVLVGLEIKDKLHKEK